MPDFPTHTDVSGDTQAKRAPGHATGEVVRRRWSVRGFGGARAGAPAVGAEISPAWEVLTGVDDAPEAPGVSVLLRRDAVFRRSLGLIDVVAAYLALLFAVLVVHGGAVQVRPTAVLVAPFVLLVIKAIGLYDRDQHLLRKTTIDEAPSIFQLSAFYALAVWLAEGLLFDGRLARSQVFALAVATFVLITMGRTLARAVALVVTTAERCVVFGSATDAARTADKLANSPGVKAAVVGRVALRVDEGEHSSSGSGTLGGAGALARVIAEYGVERVIIAPDSHDQEEILQAIRLIKALGVKVSVLPRLLEVVGSSSIFDDVGGITLLGVRQYRLSKSSEFLKRLMDLIVSAVGLALLGPFLLLLAIAVKLDSPGPVFFCQPRIGRRGEPFDMVKLRSMVRDAEQIKSELREQNEAEGGLFKISDDPRITRVGRLFRQTSLDELPQLLNVLRGNMSLVGPRPLVPDEDAQIEGWQRRRLAFRPGMTGLWQIFGSARIPMNEMVKIDYVYGANWSIWLDLKILLRTVPYVLRRRGL
jgi:exopolysaccharide biosynthesis polyprenyl glycosylphosphotransferase